MTVPPAWRPVEAHLGRDGVMTLRLDDSAGLAEASPVEMLLAAVAGCFVRSCHAVLKARGEAPVAISARVTATKARNLPARVATVEIAWAMPALSPATAERIARDAKRICTVTNSLSAEFTLLPS